jgi:acetyl esterase/lipase
MLSTLALASIAWNSFPARAAEPVTFPLWADGAPDAKGTEPADVPRLTMHLPDPATATGASVVVCPGGGYGGLAISYEGHEVAEWFAKMGIAAGVLEYRLGPKYHHPVMLNDAQRAIRTLRARACEWNLDPKRVAILGFSAGGHLASTAATHFDAGKADAPDPIDRQSSRPDRAILLYPVIAMATPYGHGGSLKNLLGDDPDPAVVASLSNETQVTPETPPTFIAQTDADTAVPPENSLLFVLALRKAKVPSELHIFEKGRHGLGMGMGEPGFSAWPGLCETWLKGQGFLDKAK